MRTKDQPLLNYCTPMSNLRNKHTQTKRVGRYPSWFYFIAYTQPHPPLVRRNVLKFIEIMFIFFLVGSAVPREDLDQIARCESSRVESVE